MAIPKWAQQHMQQKVNEGSLNYDSLGETARGTLKKPIQKPVIAPPIIKRPTLDVGALVRSGVFKSAVPTPQSHGPMDTFKQFSSNFDNAITLGLNKPLERGMDWAYGKITGKPAPQMPALPNPQTTPEKAAAITGQILGSIAPIEGLYKTVGRQALRLIPKTAPKLVQGIGKSFLPGATAMGTYEGVRSAAQGDSFPDIAKNAGIGFALGGAGDVALHGLGAGLKALRGARAATPNIPVTPRQPLALPPGRAQGMIADFSSDTGGVVRATGRTGNQLALPMGNVSKPVPKSLRPINYADRAMQELEGGILDAQNYVRHNDVLAAYPPGTTVEQAYADIAQKTGVDLPELLSRLEKAESMPSIRQVAEQQSPFARLRMASGAGPEKIGRTGRSFRVIGEPRPQQLAPQVAQPTVELDAARSILKQTNNLSRASKILQTFPELQPEFKRLTKKAFKPEQKTVKPKQPIMRTTETVPPKMKSPQKMEPTGNPGEHFRSFNVSMQNSPGVSKEVKEINWFSMQPGEKGTHIRRTHDMLSEQADSFIKSNPEKALQHATSVETLAKEPDLSVAIGIKLADHYQSIGKHEMADDALNFVSEHLTRYGQAISAARLLERMSPAGMLKTVSGKLSELNEEGAKLYGKKWQDVSLNSDEIELISKLRTGDKKAYEGTFEKIQARIADELPATAMEKINAWRHIAMLLNPKTQIRNVAGNTVMIGMRKTAKQVSATLQNVLLKPEERTQVFNVQREYKNMAEEYFEANKRELLDGPSKYKENIKLNMPDKRVFNNNALENTRKFTYKLLEMGDVPFFKNAYVNRLASYAQAKGIKDLSQLPEEAFSIAKLEAQQATYSDASELASWLNKVKNPGADANLIQKTGAVLTEAAMPFTKTPINIIKRGIQYSPAGIINGMHMWKSKGAAAAGIDEMAKGLTGTGIVSLGYLLAKNGILTGKASKDADQRAYDSSAGNSPFSILGKYTYDWMQPFSVPLAVGVEVYNALKENPIEMKKMDSVVANNDTSRLTEIATALSTGLYDALAASGDTVFNMSVLKGIKQLISNPEGPVAGLAELPGDYATQFVPTLAGQVAGVIDPTVRQTYVKGNLPESAKSALMAKTPFVSKKLQPKQTPFGTDVKRQDNGLSRAFSQFISPGIISVDQGIDPKINKEVRRLSDIGLKRHIPTMVPNYIEKTQKHPRISLTPKETTQYQKRTGELTLKAFNKVLNSNKYIGAMDSKKKNMDADEVRAEMLAKVIEEAKAQAKSEMLKSKGFNQ